MLRIKSAGPVAFAALCIVTTDAPAEALPDPDLSPLIISLGLPGSDEHATLLPRHAMRWHTSIATASHALQETAGAEAMLFDGETTRLAIAFEYGFSDRLQLGMELPFLWHESGGLDSIIDAWHKLFGFPNGSRDQFDEDRLNFLYRDNGVDVLDAAQNERGVGDIRLLAAWQLGRGTNSTTALRASLKLPTGDSAKLTGSGAADLSLGIAGHYPVLFDNPRWSGFYGAHLVLAGQPDRLADRAKSVVGVLAGGLTARVHPRLELTAQGKLRSAAYDSELRMLGDTALLLNVGGTISLSDALQLAVTVGEDVRVGTAPDVTFALTLRYLSTAP